MSEGTHKRSTVPKRLLIVAGMVGFGVVMVPLLIGRLADVQPATAMLAGAEGKANGEGRMVTVTFNSSVNDTLPWGFVPDVHSVQVPAGTTHRVNFRASNRSATSITGQAIPSIVPWQATRHFSKTECFCFSRQTLAPGETKQMPVAFRVSPELPDDIDTLTLSYTFMRVDGTATPSAGFLLSRRNQ
ncbi:cytochrome c oxidase assembly protein [Thiohalomonas denitrificans]|uniref:cytochrome c oxidase assembly protein n=1 Tax=Thiohalomonas denitrificans TaxID=415747 RepID=UPI0026F28F39|nr:cytochrome c oxidase assembly protein [Thiohalomonas denitrificans]